MKQPHYIGRQDGTGGVLLHALLTQSCLHAFAVHVLNTLAT